MTSHSLSDTLKFVLLHILAVIFSSFTYICGAVPIMVIRQAYGRIGFFVGLTVVSSLLFSLNYTFLAFTFICLALLVGIYSEMEQGGATPAGAGLLAVLFVSGVTAIFSSVYVQYNQLSLVSVLRVKILEVLAQLRDINPNIQIEVDTVMGQLPSGILAALILSLAISVISYRSLAGILRINVKEKYHTNLRTFELPNLCVWLTIVSIALVGLNLQGEWYRLVGLNLLNVMIVLYFFQGLAIVMSFFKTFRISFFWQITWLLLLVVQLFILVSLIGFVDYWLDLRKRMYRRVAPNKVDKRA
ncbi:MAG: DUF2232 domain-containing protein [Pseudomonadota bacterium]|nr:DUF2232 domain-containing protein [Pseudomonadota bacterium]